MTNTKHTPGPWRIGKGYGSVVADTPTTTRTGTGHDAVDYYGGHLICESIEMIENARLCAAAPELLEALKMVVRIADRDTREFNMAKAAIAKATGEQA